MTKPWIWNDETDECARRFVRRFYGLNRRVAVVRFITKIQNELGNRTDLDMAASAAAAYLSGEPKRFRKNAHQVESASYSGNIGKLP